MPEYEIEARGEATENYSCEAEDEDEVRAMFERGDLGDSWYTEVNGSTIVKIKKVRD